MSITQSIVNGSQTALSVGGGNFLTQSGAVRRHTFHRSLVLAEGESADAWREVTAAQKAQIEAKDAGRKRPEQAIIDECVKAGLSWNEETWLFGLNGVDDLTENDALEIMRSASNWCRYPIGTVPSMAYSNIRTHFTLGGHGNALGGVTMRDTFRQCMKLEVSIIGGGNYSVFNNTYTNCASLKKIVLRNEYGASYTASTFAGCVKLESFWTGTAINGNISFPDSPKLTLASVTNVVQKCQANAVLTLHPSAYARVTDEIFEAAAAKNVTIASA